MTGQPGRFPEGEPSVESVTAALARAQEVAMARAAAVRDGEAGDESARGRGGGGSGGVVNRERPAHSHRRERR